MTREELAHILRAAAQIANDNDILVIGSQSILGTFGEDDLPPAAYGSIEADIAFFDDPDERKADRVDGAIGEASSFHEQFGIYAQGVSLNTAVLPAGWRDRLVPYKRDDAEPSQARCLEAHDLAISKLVVGREKDLLFVKVLVRAQLISCKTLRERAAALDVIEGIRRRVLSYIDGLEARPADDRPARG